jgi:hypothetical protein
MLWYLSSSPIADVRCATQGLAHPSPGVDGKPPKANLGPTQWRVRTRGAPMGVQVNSSQNFHINKQQVVLLFFTYDSCGKRRTHLAIPQSMLAKAQTQSARRTAGERAMTYIVKERIAECYRRAEDYKRLYHRASSSDEREACLSTRREFLRLAENLAKAHTVPRTKRLA